MILTQWIDLHTRIESLHAGLLHRLGVDLVLDIDDTPDRFGMRDCRSSEVLRLGIPFNTTTYAANRPVA